MVSLSGSRDKGQLAELSGLDYVLVQIDTVTQQVEQMVVLLDE